LELEDLEVRCRQDSFLKIDKYSTGGNDLFTMDLLGMEDKGQIAN